jgi:AAA ATPase domain
MPENSNIKGLTQIVTEQPESFSLSPFSSAYIKAKEIVEEIISEQSIKNDDKNKRHFKASDSPNNIIAFTGERGIGKSSTMTSFMSALIKNNDGSHFLNEKFRMVNFIGLDVIDPSLFRGDESIFEIILAKMFVLFKTALQDNSIAYNLSDDSRRGLIHKFQKVYDTFKVTKKDSKDLYEQETIDSLISLAKGSNLKDSFNELVEEYLNALGKKDVNKLLITIDDFDLKTNGVHEMFEDIRQLLINKNIIILIGCKLDQLKDSLKRNLYIEMGNVPISYKPAKNIAEQIDKYLEKLLPNRNIIQLLSRDQKEILTYLINTTEDNSDFSAGEEKKLSEQIHIDTNNENLQSDEGNLSYSKQADNILIKLIENKLDFYISKREQTNSVLYTNTLRSINELINSTGDLDSFTKYILRIFDYALDKTLLEQIWNCEPVLINVITLKYCSSHFLKYVPDNLYSNNKVSDGDNPKKILEKLANATNYENVQFGDIVSIFKILKDNISITSPDFTRLQLVKLIYNLRRRELISSNPNYILQSSLSGLIHSQYLNDNQRIRKHQATKKYRDHFIVSYSPPKPQDSEFWVLQSLGKASSVEFLNTNTNFYNYNSRYNPVFKNFAFNIYNHRFLFSLRENDIKNGKDKLAVLSQNTDFVIDVYNEIVNRFEKLSKNGEINKTFNFSDELAALEREIKNKILPDFGIKNTPLVIKGDEKFTLYFNNAINDFQGPVSSINDINHIIEPKPFQEIIAALEAAKAYNTIEGLFKKIDDADVDIRKFLTSPKFIEQIKADKSGNNSTKTRNLLKEKLKEALNENSEELNIENSIEAKNEGIDTPNPNLPSQSDENLSDFSGPEGKQYNPDDLEDSSNGPS